jgi:hypothetical protein
MGDAAPLIPLVPEAWRVLENVAVVQAPVEPAVVPALSEEAADFLEMVGRLRAALGDVRGKIRVGDVHALAWLARPTYYRMNLIARALRHLGWRRARYRFDGVVRYAYARGTRLQREDILEIERGVGDQYVLVKRTS